MKYLINFFIIISLGFFLHSCTTIDKKANKAISKEEAEAAQERMMQRFRQQFQGGGPGGGGE